MLCSPNKQIKEFVVFGNRCAFLYKNSLVEYVWLHISNISILNFKGKSDVHNTNHECVVLELIVHYQRPNEEAKCNKARNRTSQLFYYFITIHDYFRNKWLYIVKIMYTEVELTGFFISFFVHIILKIKSKPVIQVHMYAYTTHSV